MHIVLMFQVSATVVFLFAAYYFCKALVGEDILILISISVHYWVRHGTP